MSSKPKTLLSLLMALSIPPMSHAAGLDDLFRVRAGRSHRASSFDPDWRDGNRDWREIAPGETITLADIGGPGVIRHMWFTVNANDPRYPRSLVVRMYWDECDAPAVESPMGDFFAVGHGERRYVDSIPVANTSEGRAYNCYWPMPFRKHARITVTNDSREHPVPKFYYYIDYDSVPELPDDTAYFHARYRQEWPAGRGDYLICEAEGKGHYVGTVLSVQIRTKGWFGEGDDRFYIDGEEVPGLHGTGTEDYFCDAWGFREFNRPYYGVVMMEGFEVGDRVCVYRWHIADPIVFTKSLRFTMEHKGTMLDEAGKHVSGHHERPDLFSSVAFWYQTGPAKRFAEVPPLEERLVRRTMIELEPFIENVTTKPAATEVTLQKGWGSGKGQILAHFQEAGGRLTLPFEVDEDISGVIRLALTRGWDYGAWRVTLDGEVIPRLRGKDLHHGEFTITPFLVRDGTLTIGRHVLEFECTGRHPSARACLLGIDGIMIEHIDTYAVPVDGQRKKAAP